MEGLLRADAALLAFSRDGQGRAVAFSHARIKSQKEEGKKRGGLLEINTGS